jgi:hypothetical protein
LLHGVGLEAGVNQGADRLGFDGLDVGRILDVFLAERDIPVVEPEASTARRRGDQGLERTGDGAPQRANRPIGEPAASSLVVAGVQRRALHRFGQADDRRRHPGCRSHPGFDATLNALEVQLLEVGANHLHISAGAQVQRLERVVDALVLGVHLVDERLERLRRHTGVQRHNQVGGCRVAEERRLVIRHRRIGGQVGQDRIQPRPTTERMGWIGQRAVVGNVGRLEGGDHLRAVLLGHRVADQLAAVPVHHLVSDDNTGRVEPGQDIPVDERATLLHPVRVAVQGGVDLAAGQKVDRGCRRPRRLEDLERLGAEQVPRSSARPRLPDEPGLSEHQQPTRHACRDDRVVCTLHRRQLGERAAGRDVANPAKGELVLHQPQVVVKGQRRPRLDGRVTGG